MSPALTRAALLSATALALGLAAPPAPAQQVTITETSPASPRGAIPGTVTPADRDAARRHIDRANGFYNAEQYVQAAREYRMATQRDPSDAEAWDGLADSLYHGGFVDSSIIIYQRAIKLDMPDPAGPSRSPSRTADAYRQLGIIRQKKNQFISAVANFRASLKLAPDDALTHADLGDALYGREAYDSAAAEYRAALRLDPAGRDLDLGGVHVDLGNCYRASGHSAPAVAEYRKAVRLDPNDFVSHYQLGVGLSDLGRYPEAIRELHEAARLNPRDADTHNALGAALYNSGQIEAGRIEWRKALRMGDPDAADTAREYLSKFQ